MLICKEPDTGKSSGSIGVARKLSSVQRMATTAIMGALRTSASDVLEVHANLLPVELLLHSYTGHAIEPRYDLPPCQSPTPSPSPRGKVPGGS